jgi:hypothetical protein
MKLVNYENLDWSESESLDTQAGNDSPYQQQKTDERNGAIGEMRTGRGDRITRRKPSLVPLCAPQIPHDLTWARTQAAAAVGSRRLAGSA